MVPLFVCKLVFYRLSILGASDEAAADRMISHASEDHAERHRYYVLCYYYRIRSYLKESASPRNSATKTYHQASFQYSNNVGPREDAF